jgi:PAS domain S-box-containing protein
MHFEANSPLFAFLRAWWVRLTEPLSTVQNPRERRQSRLMASLTLAAALVLSILIFIPKQTTTEIRDANNWFFFGVVVISAVIISYALSRFGRYRLGSTILIVASDLAIFLPTLWIGGITSYNALFYLVISTLFGSLFFGPQIALYLSIAHIAGLLLLGPFVPGIRASEIYLGPLSFNALCGALIVLFDVHWRRGEAEQNEALKAGEERYRIITELISDYAYSTQVEPDGSLRTDWVTQDSFSRLTGYLPHELNEADNRLGFKLYHPDEVEAVQQEVQRAIAGEMTHSERRIITQDGQVRWLQIDRHPVWDASRQRVIRYYGVATDITERKEAELALKASEERYRLISELISDFAYFYRFNPDGSKIREWITGASYLRVTGYTPDELTSDQFAARIHVDDLERLLKDRESVSQGQSCHGEYRFYTKDGTLRWLSIDRYPVWNDDHTRLAGYYAIAKDITERKQAEADQLRMALEHEQITMVNQFVQAVSHDFRTLLSTIETSRYLIERRLEDAARTPVQEKLDVIHNAVSHLTTQLESLHMVSMLGQPSLNLADLNGLIERLVQKHDLKARQKRIRITFSPDPLLVPFMLDTTKMEQAISHLLNNAITFTAEGGLIELATRLDTDHSVLIEVRDTGAGIDPEALPHIFKPFFRGDASRPVDSGGVGLGLTIVRMIVDTHHGEIQVKSELGKGTSFHIRIPMTQAVRNTAPLLRG